EPLQLRLGGRFNVSNALAALGVAQAVGLDWERSKAALAAVPGVPGRFESVDAGQEFAVIVDYAHTPDGLLNVLNGARALEPARATWCSSPGKGTKTTRSSRIERSTSTTVRSLGRS